MPRLLVVAAVLLAAAPAFAREVPAKDGRALWVETDKDPVATLPGAAPDFSVVARSVREAVVSITATSKEDSVETDTPSARDFFERYYGGAEPPTKGMASGFLIRSDGYILTNEHVVEDASALAVTLSTDEDRSYPAVVVGRDDLSDLALIHIEAGRPLPALALGDSDGLSVGDWVTAIGNPFGLNHSLTVGVISYIGRRDINPSGRPGYYDFIQTDASINPGNSGGPLLDRHGRVVGISAAVNASGQGIGFAIPVNMAKDVLPALFETGSIKRSFLGVSIQDLSPDLAASFGVEEGVVVTEVASNSPAAQAGLQVGDVITRFGEQPVAHAYRLRWLASSAGVGARASVFFLRAGTPRVVEVALAPLPGATAKFHREPPPRPRSDLAPFGFSVGGPVVSGPNGKGLRVTAVDPTSPVYVAGLREGDVLMSAADKAVRAPKDLAGALRGRSVARLFLQRGLKPLFVGFRLSPAAGQAPEPP